MDTYALDKLSDTVRVRWVHDEDYQTRGSYDHGTEADTRAAEDWELERLGDGRLVTLGAIVEVLCPHCDEWSQRDSLWGIVIDGSKKVRCEYADDVLDIPELVAESG